MTERIISTTFILMWLLFPGGYALAESEKAVAAADKSSQQIALSVEQIVDRTNHVAYYQGFDGRAKVKMTITDSQGRRRNRELTILRWDQPDPNLPAKEQRRDSSFCG